MSFKLKCPNSDKHTRFTVTAHVAEYWVVDTNCHYLESRRSEQVVHPPDSEDVYECDICGTVAEVIDIR